MNELLGKHTAILGSTDRENRAQSPPSSTAFWKEGAGAAYAKWQPRIIILDPHSEYPAAFPAHKKLSTDDGSLTLPYWLLNFQESIALLIGKTEFVATSQANIVKAALLKARVQGAQELGLDPNKITVDSPVPYKLSVFKAAVEADKPSQPSKQDSHNSILEKLDVLVRDARFASSWQNGWVGNQDPFPAIIEQLVGAGPQPRIIDLSGVPMKSQVYRAPWLLAHCSTLSMAECGRAQQRPCAARVRRSSPLCAKQRRGPV